MTDHDPEAIPPAAVEFAKATLEYLRHLATLSTGSIVLVATFLDKLFDTPAWKAAVIVSLIGFLLSVVSNIVAYSIIIMTSFPRSFKMPVVPAAIEKVVGGAIFFTWLGFLVGIFGLALFAIRNLIE